MARSRSKQGVGRPGFYADSGKHSMNLKRASESERSHAKAISRERAALTQNYVRRCKAALAASGTHGPVFHRSTEEHLTKEAESLLRSTLVKYEGEMISLAERNVLARRSLDVAQFYIEVQGRTREWLDSYSEFAESLGQITPAYACSPYATGEGEDNNLLRVLLPLPPVLRQRSPASGLPAVE